MILNVDIEMKVGMVEPKKKPSMLGCSARLVLQLAVTLSSVKVVYHSLAIPCKRQIFIWDKQTHE